MSLFWELFPADVHSLRLLLAENRETGEFEGTLCILESLIMDALVKVSREMGGGDSEVLGLAVEQFKTRITNGTGRFLTKWLLKQRLQTAKEQAALNRKKLFEPFQGVLGLKKSMQDQEFFEKRLRVPEGWFSAPGEDGGANEEDLILAKTVISAIVLVSKPAWIYWHTYTRCYGAKHGIDAEIEDCTGINVWSLCRERDFRDQVWGEIDELSYDPEDKSRNDSPVKNFVCSLVESIREAKHKWRDAEGNAGVVDWYDAIRLGGECLSVSSITKIRNNELSRVLAIVKNNLDSDDKAIERFVELFREIEEIKPLPSDSKEETAGKHPMPRTLDWLQRLPRREEPVIPFRKALESLLRVKASSARPEVAIRRPVEDETEETRRQGFVNLISDGLEDFEKRNLLDFLLVRMINGDSLFPLKERDSKPQQEESAENPLKEGYAQTPESKNVDAMPQLFRNLVEARSLTPRDIYPEENCDSVTSLEVLSDWIDIRHQLADGGWDGQPDLSLSKHPPAELVFRSSPAQQQLVRAKDTYSGWLTSPDEDWQPEIDEEQLSMIVSGRIREQVRRVVNAEVAEQRLIMIASVMRAFHQIIGTYRAGGE